MDAQDPVGPSGSGRAEQAAPTASELRRLVDGVTSRGLVHLAMLVAAAATLKLARIGVPPPAAPALPAVVLGWLVVRGGLPAIPARLWRTSAVMLGLILYATTAVTVGL